MGLHVERSGSAQPSVKVLADDPSIGIRGYLNIFGRHMSSSLQRVHSCGS